MDPQTTPELFVMIKNLQYAPTKARQIAHWIERNHLLSRVFVKLARVAGGYELRGVETILVKAAGDVDT